MNWMGNYGPDYLETAHIAVMDDVFAEDFDETQPTDRMERRQCSRHCTNSAIFGTRKKKGDVIAMKGYVANGRSLSLEILFGMLPLEAKIHEPSAIRG